MCGSGEGQTGTVQEGVVVEAVEVGLFAMLCEWMAAAVVGAEGGGEGERRGWGGIIE